MPCASRSITRTAVCVAMIPTSFRSNRTFLRSIQRINSRVSHSSEQGSTTIRSIEIQRGRSYSAGLRIPERHFTSAITMISTTTGTIGSLTFSSPDSSGTAARSSSGCRTSSERVFRSSPAIFKSPDPAVQYWAAFQCLNQLHKKS